MEPAETIKGPLEFLVKDCALEIAHLLVKPHHVGFDASGRLLGHQLTSLQKRDREVLVWVRTQEESELGINVCLDNLLDDAFKFWHEGDAEMAVSQIHPVSFLSSFLEEGFGLITLTLSKGSALNVHLHLLCEGEQLVSWVNSWRKNEYDWNSLI